AARLPDPHEGDTLTLTVTPSLPDLTVSSVTGKSFSFFKSRFVLVTTRITNMGTVPATSHTLLVHNTTTGKQQTYTVMGLAPGASVSKMTLFSITAKKTVAIQATVDPKNAVTESDEGNNTRVISVTTP
ncbi:hypothetical protein KAZ57_00920, partial [Patescibacteria group bacterium]|nr:hypothetical protein [Patescibacteria group bacterium]